MRKFTDEDLAILQLFAQGASHEVAGKALGISKRTCQTRAANLKARLGVDSMCQALSIAIGLGQIEAHSFPMSQAPTDRWLLVFDGFDEQWHQAEWGKATGQWKQANGMAMVQPTKWMHMPSGGTD